MESCRGRAGKVSQPPRCFFTNLVGGSASGGTSTQDNRNSTQPRIHARNTALWLALPSGPDRPSCPQGTKLMGDGRRVWVPAAVIVVVAVVGCGGVPLASGYRAKS